MWIKNSPFAQIAPKTRKNTPKIGKTNQNCGELLHIVLQLNNKNKGWYVEITPYGVGNYKKLSKNGEFFIIYPQTDVRFLTCPQNTGENKCMKKEK